MKKRKENARRVIVCSAVLCLILLVGCESPSEDGYSPEEWAILEEEGLLDDEQEDPTVSQPEMEPEPEPVDGDGSPVEEEPEEEPDTGEGQEDPSEPQPEPEPIVVELIL